MLRIAVIFESSPFDRKGLFNAVHNRIKYLLAAGGCSIDAYCIHGWDTPFTRRIRRTPLVEKKEESIEVDGLGYRMLWYDFSVADNLLVEKLRMGPYFFKRDMGRWLPLFGEYDCIVAHSFTGAVFAQSVSARYGIPYFVTWHGSDVHTFPFRNSRKFRDTASAMEGAACNFFVSGKLMEISDRITVNARKEVLYNGVTEGFERFPDHCREELRRNNGLSDDDKVVAFVGSIVAVKNVSVLQPLFHEIRERYEGPLKFWMVGDGKLRDSVIPALAADSSIDVSFWGNVPAEHMPSVMNCVDVLVLPSLNEGLPLVCAEAIRCGAAVAGSDAGGIPEVIGRDSVVPLGEDFVSRMAGRVVQMLVDKPVQTVPAELDWTSTAEKELSVMKSSLGGGSGR